MRIARPLTCAAVVLALAGPRPAAAALITVNYEATVTTVSGTPFGLSPAVGTVARGFFTYNTDTPDTLPGDPQRGNYPHVLGGGAFRAELPGLVVTGSDTPLVEIFRTRTPPPLSINADSFFYRDGPPGGGVLSRNGTPDPGISLLINIATGVNTGLPPVFSSDALPDPFPPAFSPPFLPGAFFTTFTLSDGGGTLQLRFTSVSQQAQPPTAAVPEPASLALLGLGAAGVLGYRRQRRKAEVA